MTVYTVTSKMPKWAIHLMKKEGIPLSFDPDHLTDEQVQELSFILSLVELVADGFMDVVWDGENEPRFRITEKGLREVEKTLPER